MSLQRFTTLALASCFIAGSVLLNSDLSLGDPDSNLLLYLWITSTLLLLFRLLKRSATKAATWQRALRLLAAIVLAGALVPGVIAVLAKTVLERRAAAVDCESQHRYVAMHRGGFGSTWFDVIEMKQLLPMVYVTRALKQYERETVIGLRCRSGGGVDVRLGEFGKPDRIQTLGL